MGKHVISILTENSSGVLSRVTGLFSRRGYNIDSLSVGISEVDNLARITVVAHGDAQIIEQIKKQVEKLENTVSAVELLPDESVFRELALIKVSVGAGSRAEIVSIADIFRAKIIDVSPQTLTIEMTGETSKIDAFITLVKPYGIKELARTGATALSRGLKSEEFN